ncbi:MAG: nucleotidyltransferase domain-containing protein [Oscillospiraceae bacterium]|nr:nucleotidyltransferase domain-containing protein [Oscillospiraceae bacterium]
MKEQYREEIDEIVKSILSAVPVSEIYLFGSFAKGEETPDSDFDFYVVIPDDSGMRELEANWAIDGAIVGRKRDIDMIVGTQNKFNKRQNYLYSVENEVKETGVKLHG